MDLGAHLAEQSHGLFIPGGKGRSIPRGQQGQAPSKGSDTMIGPPQMIDNFNIISMALHGKK